MKISPINNNCNPNFGLNLIINKEFLEAPILQSQSYKEITNLPAKGTAHLEFYKTAQGKPMFEFTYRNLFKQAEARYAQHLELSADYFLGRLDYNEIIAEGNKTIFSKLKTLLKNLKQTSNSLSKNIFRGF